MTQKQLSRISGVSQQYISDLEQGKFRRRSPTLKIIRDIAKALDVCVFAIIEPDDCPLDYGKCKRSIKISLHDDFKIYAEALEKISKDNNVPMTELVAKSVELLKKEYSS